MIREAEGALQRARSTTSEVAGRIRSYSVVIFSNPKEAKAFFKLRDLYGFTGDVIVSRGLSSDKRCLARQEVQNHGFKQKVLFFPLLFRFS